MNIQFQNPAIRTIVYVAGFLVITTCGLWSWNTLADLFGTPQAQYKHLIAAIALMLITRYFLFGHTQIRTFRRRREPGNAA